MEEVVEFERQFNFVSVSEIVLNKEEGGWGCLEFYGERFTQHNCFGPPSLLVEDLLSTGATQSSFYLLVEIGLPLNLFPVFMW